MSASIVRRPCLRGHLGEDFLVSRSYGPQVLLWIVGILPLILGVGTALADDEDLPLPTSPQGDPLGLTTLSLLELLQKGGPVMILLGVVFLIFSMLIMIYILTMRRGALISGKYLSVADAMLKKRDFLGLLAISNRHHEGSAQVMRRVLDFGEQNPDVSVAELREIAQAEGTRHVTLMNQRVAYLADIATLAPMLGLLGTVVGIIRSFGVLASQSPDSSSLVLAGGVAEALVTTGAGLIIGILAAGFYALFRGRVQKIASDFEAGIAYLIALYAQQKNVRAQRSQSRRLADDF